MIAANYKKSPSKTFFRNAFQAIEEHQNGAAPTARNGGSGGGGVAGNGVGGGVSGSGSGVSTCARARTVQSA